MTVVVFHSIINKMNDFKEELELSKKILVVGGVAGGASIAARARRLDEHAEIIMFEKGPYVSFSNCALPYHISGEIESSTDLLLKTPASFQEQYKIDARVHNEVVGINRTEKTVTVKNHQTGDTYTEEYDLLFLAPGAEAVRPKSIPGIMSDHVFVMKTVPDVEYLMNHLEAEKVKDAVVVGGGFIGLEVAENLKYAGYNVTVVEAQEQVMMSLDYDMVQMIHKELHDQGVKLIVNDSVEEITETDVVLASGEEIPAQAVVMAIGVRPEIELAQSAGLTISETTGAIAVNHHYQTNDSAIYAVGDAIESACFFTGKKTQLTLAGPAQRQARAAIDHAYGRNPRNRGVIGSSSLKLFDLNIANTGFNEKQLKEHGIPYDFTYIIPKDRVGIMPDAENLHFKLLYEVPSGRVIGAQAIGKGNVDKRIDVIATAIMMHATLEDLMDLELTYSPHFSNARGVINNAGMVGLNILNGEMAKVPVTQARKLVEDGAFLVDIRSEEAFAKGHLKGAINIPFAQFRKRLAEIPKDQPVYLYCRSGQLTYNMSRALTQLGYNNIQNIEGSFLGISYYEYFNDMTLDREPIVTGYNFK